MSKGNFIEYVVSDDPNKYPDGCEHNGYYWELVNKIEFKIQVGSDFNTYYAAEGMTWADWVESVYNTDNYICNVYNHVIGPDGVTPVMVSGGQVYGNNIIDPNIEYRCIPLPSDL